MMALTAEDMRKQIAALKGKAVRPLDPATFHGWISIDNEWVEIWPGMSEEATRRVLAELDRLDGV